MPLNIDVANIGGNVTVQVYNRNIQIKEFECHNHVTDEGIVNLLNCLARETTSYIKGISILTGSVTNPEEHKFYSFTSTRVVYGNSPYAEFKFYLGTTGASIENINGKTIVGCRLLTSNSVGIELPFAEVTSADVIPGSEDDTGTPKKVFTPIDKTTDISVVVIWRIGITSIFTNIIQ